MSTHSFEEIWDEIAPPLDSALGFLYDHRKAVLDQWRDQGRSLGLTAEEFEALSAIDVKAVRRALESNGVQSFARLATAVGEDLARRGIGFERAIAAYAGLEEICLHFLAPAPSRRRTRPLALTRASGLAAAYLAAGFDAQPSQIDRSQSLESRIADLEARLRRASASSVAELYERERRRFSHDLHDEIGHDLMLLKLRLEMIALDLNAGSTASIRPKVEEMIAIVTRTIDSVRRLVLDLGPAILDELGFLPAIRAYARRFTRDTGIEVKIRVLSLAEHIPVSHQVALYRVLQGALSNVHKHSRAKNVTISLGAMKDSVLILLIQDDGIGFDTSLPLRRASVGLTAMRERVEALGGRFHVESVRQGASARRHGTRVEIDLPLPEVGRRLS